MPGRKDIPYDDLRTQRLKTNVRKYYLSGVTSRMDIATALGVSLPTVTKYLRKVREDLKSEHKEDCEHLKDKYRAMFMALYQQAEQAYQISRGGVLEDDTELAECEECNGTGRVEDRPQRYTVCTVCEGEKYIEHPTKRIVGQGPGDVTFLRVKKEILSELGKLDGLYPNAATGARLLRRVEDTGDKRLEEMVQEIYFDGPTELIVHTIGAIEQFREMSKARQVIETTAVVTDNTLGDESEDGAED